MSKTKSRPSPLSAEEQAKRRPPPPHELVGALQDRPHPSSGRLIAATPIHPKQAEKGALATHYRLKKGAVFGSHFERSGSVFLPDVPADKFYALLEVEPGTETDAGARSIHVRRTDTMPLDVDEFLARLQRAETAAAAATEKMQRWFERACPRCRSMVEEQAGVVGAAFFKENFPREEVAQLMVSRLCDKSRGKKPAKNKARK